MTIPPEVYSLPSTSVKSTRFKPFKKNLFTSFHTIHAMIYTVYWNHYKLGFMLHIGTAEDDIIHNDYLLLTVSQGKYFFKIDQRGELMWKHFEWHWCTVAYGKSMHLETEEYQSPASLLRSKYQVLKKVHREIEWLVLSPKGKTKTW